MDASSKGRSKKKTGVFKRDHLASYKEQPKLYYFDVQNKGESIR